MDSSTDAIILPDVLSLHLDVVFCGMAAGARSAQRRAYYAGPGNRFWGVLHEIGFTSVKLQPDQYKCIDAYGLGLTDLAKNQYGSDLEVKVAQTDRVDLAAKIRKYEPRYLAFNGKGSAKGFLQVKAVGYGLQSVQVGNTRIFVLPSTSRAANGFWSIEPWMELYSLVIQDVTMRPMGS